MKRASLLEGPYDFINKITNKRTTFQIYHTYKSITVATQESLTFEHRKKISRILDKILLETKQDISNYIIQTLTL